MGSQRILFIAPLPPPIHGQSVASDAFLRSLSPANMVKVVNTAGPRRSGVLSSIGRACRVLWLQVQIFVHAWRADRIYLTTSETIGGNLKDLLTFMLCLPKLGRMFLHLHGGAGMRVIMSPAHPFLRVINGFFLQRMAGVIVLGESLRGIFKGTVRSPQLHVVHNFAHDELALDEQAIKAKFHALAPCRLLYLSNMIPSKGFGDLLEGFLRLSETVRKRFVLDFAGAFQDPVAETAFRSLIAGHSNIAYHGVVRGDPKRRLLQHAHLFFLPTYYPYEGQPISILEAYAAGCVVVTTNHSGIRDIFADGRNGFEVEKRSPDAIAALLRDVAEDSGQLMPVALWNAAEFRERYRVGRYCDALAKVLGVAVSAAAK